MKKLNNKDLDGILLGLACVLIIIFTAAAVSNKRLRKRVNSLEESITATTTTELTTTEETTEETTTTTTTTEPVKVKPLLIQDMERRLSTLKALIKETRDKAETLLDKQKKGEQLTADDELYLRFYSSAVFEKQEIEAYLEKYDEEEE